MREERRDGVVSSEGVGWSGGGVGSSSCPWASFCALVVVPSSCIVVVLSSRIVVTCGCRVQ